MKSKGKRQISKGKRAALYFSFDFAFGSQGDFLKSEKMALHPNRLLPFAFCLLRFAF
jgi:hypothetical protein